MDRTITGSYDQVFQATLEVLRGRGFSLKEVDRDEGCIVTARRPAPMRAEGARSVETVDARVEAIGERAEVRLLFAFHDQLSGTPRDVPDDGDGDRFDDVASAAFDRSVDAEQVYRDYFDAIKNRVRSLRGR